MLHLLGQVVAHDILFRHIYAAAAMAMPDPAAWLFETVELIVGSMDNLPTRPRSKAEQAVWDYAAGELHRFADEVGKRLGDDGRRAAEGDGPR